VGVRTTDAAPAGTPVIVYAPPAFVVAMPPNPPLALTWTPASPAAFSVIVPPIVYEGGVPASQSSRIDTCPGRLVSRYVMKPGVPDVRVVVFATLLTVTPLTFA
jgi:hypothetical protein